MSMSQEQLRLQCFHAVNHPDKHMPQLLSEAGKLYNHIMGIEENTDEEEPTTFVERVRTESVDLWIKIQALEKFISSEAFSKIDEDERHDLDNQHFYMRKYAHTLGERLKRYDANGM